MLPNLAAVGVVRPQRPQDQYTGDSEENAAKSKHGKNSSYCGRITYLPSVLIIHGNAVAVMRDGQNARKYKEKGGNCGPPPCKAAEEAGRLLAYRAKRSLIGSINAMSGNFAFHHNDRKWSFADDDEEMVLPMASPQGR